MEQFVFDHGLRALYARFANHWHNSIVRLGYMRAYADLVRAGLAQSAAPFGHVLDVGTGTGALSLAVLELVPDVGRLTLLDTSKEMLAEAEANLQVASVPVVAIAAGIGAGQIKPASVDTLLCAHVIEHTPDAAACLLWFAERLKPGGRLFLSVSKPHWCTALVRWRWGHKAYHPEEILRMLRQVGFYDVEIVPYQAGPPSRLSCGYLARV